MNVWEKHAEILRRRRQAEVCDRWLRRHPVKAWFLLVGFSVLVGEVAVLLRYLITGTV